MENRAVWLGELAFDAVENGYVKPYFEGIKNVLSNYRKDHANAIARGVDLCDGDGVGWHLLPSRGGVSIGIFLLIKRFS